MKATVGDYGLDFSRWPADDDRDEFLDVNREARTALAAAHPLALSEIATWTALGDRPVVQRLGLWDDPIDIQPILEFSHAVDDLVTDRLEDPPPGTMWLFGFRSGRCTINVRSDAQEAHGHPS